MLVYREKAPKNRHEKRGRFTRLDLCVPIEMLVAPRAVTSVDRGHGGENNDLSGILLTHPSEDHSEAAPPQR